MRRIEIIPPFCRRCVLGYLPEIDSSKIGVAGHNRCGKADLWAGVIDTRFAWVMPNNSGCCGAALLRDKYSENMASINMMGYWLVPAFGKFAGREHELPFDQHTVLVLVAPRLLHVAIGSTDFWVDPAGKHRSTVLTSEIYQLYGNSKIDKSFPRGLLTCRSWRLGQLTPELTPPIF